MVRSGAIKDASYLWWTLRPSARFPTLKLRIADSCTRLEDTLTIAALYRCLVRRLDRDSRVNRSLTNASRAIASENMWRAQRDGVRASFIDESGETSTFDEYLERILADVAEDAEALGCSTETARARVIVSEGASADRQRSIFANAQASGRTPREALTMVVDWMAAASAPERSTRPSE